MHLLEDSDFIQLNEPINNTVYYEMDTRLNNCFYFGSLGKPLYISPEAHYMSVGEAGRHVVNFLDLVFLSGSKVKNHGEACIK